MPPVPTKQVLDDGLCFVQPLLKVGATPGHASSHEMGQAAFTLLHTCVMKQGVGGIAGKIGGGNRAL